MHEPGQGIRPNEWHEQMADVDFEALVTRGYYIIDVDNTLVLQHSQEVAAELVTLFRNLRAKKLVKDVCLVSNIVAKGRHRQSRIARIAKQIDAHFVCARGRHSKPHPLPFQQAMKLMGSIPQNTIVIGDQLFTDIRGGNRLGLYTIWVSPLGKGPWFMWLRRLLERWFARRWQ